VSESFYNAKPIKGKPLGAGPIDSDNIEIDDSLNMYEIQKLLFDVQSKMEDTVRQRGALLNELLEAEDAWKAHESRVIILVRDRIMSQDPTDKNKEKTSTDLRSAEVLQERNEEGVMGKTLHRAYRGAEVRVEQYDSYIRVLEKRGSLLQTLASNLRGAT
jgi:hypothetical protein